LQQALRTTLFPAVSAAPAYRSLLGLLERTASPGRVNNGVRKEVPSKCSQNGTLFCTQLRRYLALVVRQLLKEEEEEEDYQLWPANKSDRSWQSLSNPAKRHSFVSN